MVDRFADERVADKVDSVEVGAINGWATGRGDAIDSIHVVEPGQCATDRKDCRRTGGDRDVDS